jgi:2-amino-4-hydroxy-6-hydroxymethyldihydropteridine diphosphokinase
MKKIAYISLGSNLGDREANLREAIIRLGELGMVRAVSSLYETEPVGVQGQQPWFLNAAVETELPPLEFLGRVLQIEQSMGRVRTVLRGPRTVDLDIVLFGGDVLDMPGLTVPHPAMQQRRFVLAPLAEIAPNVRHPVLQKSVHELLDSLPADAGRVSRLQPN